MGRRRTRYVAAAALAALVVGLLGWRVARAPAAHVVVRNASGATVRGVRVVTPAGTHDVGDLPDGAAAETTIPRGSPIDAVVSRELPDGARRDAARVHAGTATLLPQVHEFVFLPGEGVAAGSHDAFDGFERLFR